MALADINIRIGANIQQLEKSLSKAQRNLNRFSRKMRASGRNMSRNVTLPLVAAGGVAVKFAADFETAMVEVQKVTDKTTADKLAGSIRRMAEEIPMSQRALAGLAADAARFGIRGSENIESFTRTVAKMAEATDLTADVAGEALAKISTQANVPVSDIENLGSAINELSNNFATSSGEIVDAMLRSSATMSNFGLNATQIAGVSAQMNAMSESAERAGTRMRSLFQSLQDPKKIKDIAEAVGMTVDEFKAIKQNNPQQALMILVNAMSRNGQEAENLRGVLERTARTALTALAKNTDDLTRALGMSEQAFKDNTSLQSEFEAASKTFNARLTKMMNTLRNVAITVGNMLMPYLEKLMEKIKAVANWFAGLSSKAKAMIVAIAAVLAAIGPLTVAIGLVASGISSFIGLMTVLTGPVGLVIAAVGALAAAVLYVWDNWKAVSERISDVSWWKNTLISMVEFLAKQVVKMVDLLTWPIRKVAEVLGVEIPTIETNLQPLFDKLNSLKSEPKKYKHEFGSFLDAVKNGAYQAADALGIMNAAVGGGGGGTSTTKPQTFSEAGRGSAISTMQSKGPDQIDTDNTIPGMKLRAFVPTNEQLAGIDEFTKRWQLAGEEINRAVEYALEDVAANMAEIIGQMGKGAAGMEAIGGMIFTTLGNLAQRVGKIAIGVAISIEGIKKALQSLNPAAAFAAGVALIALGAMVKKNLGGIGADNTPRLGRGGLATSPTTAIIGDNPSGKEAVIPFERMGEFLSMVNGGNSQPQELYSHITNDGIYMSNKRGVDRNKRLT
jgi:TP901 family phage tail tape measure protein